MLMPSAQINPLLIQLLADKEASEIPDSPTPKMLPGKYVKTIIKNKESLNPIIKKNHQMLTCKSCGRKGKYDVGLIVMNIEKDSKTKKISDDMQTTGYFRCKHCNAAGNWELPASLTMSAITSLLPAGHKQKRTIVGKSLLFDGSWHRFSTDAEEHLLKILQENPQDSFVWNRLGNLYHKGNRPDLAVSVFEHSIKIDPGQVESHFTLGDMLAQISKLEEAGYHFRQMLLYAEEYKKIPAENLREMLANGLMLLFLISQHTNGEVSFFPTLEEVQASGRNDASWKTNDVELDLEIDPNDVDSFLPLAEMFMGIRAKEIPRDKRTFHLSKTSNVSSSQRNHKKKKKKRKR